MRLRSPIEQFSSEGSKALPQGVGYCPHPARVYVRGHVKGYSRAIISILGGSGGISK